MSLVTLHHSTSTVLDESRSHTFMKTLKRRRRPSKCNCDGATCRSMKQILNDENDDNNNSNDDSFLNWLTSSSSSASPKGDESDAATPKKSAMVQPIGYDGQPLAPKQTEVNRIRPNFGNLFQGMPSLNDIMGSSSSNDATSMETDEEEDDDDDDDSYINSSNSNKNNVLGRPKRRRFSTEEVDETWFEKERLQIKSKYDTILKDMLDQIQSERKHDPESVPNNAEELMKSVLKQEMEIEMKEMKQQRNEERYMSYDQSTRQKESENVDTTNYISPNPNIQRLMDESEAEYVKQSTSRNELQDFLQYQSRKQEELSNEQVLQLPSTNENLDQWALDRLKDMANARKDTDADEMILDILQENVNQLENDMRKENDKLSKFTTNQQPQTMKEWQMYRSIASRMDKNSDNNATNDSNNNTNTISERDDLIMQQLKLWKEYIVKEESHRKESGLTRGPKLPFAWQESVLGAQKNNRYDDESLSPLTNDKASRIETRKKVNRMSIEAMESLLLKTDPARREKLQKEIDYLKSTLEANDYLDIDESTFDDTNDAALQQQTMLRDGSVDTTNLFTSSTDWSDEDNDLMAWDTSSSRQNPAVFASESIITDTMPSTNDNIDDGVTSRPIPPPKTAFFSSIEEDGEYDLGETFTGDSKLGTMEEQKLEAMFRRAGAKTPEERKIIQTQWEEFQQLEKNKRQQSGLTDGDLTAVDSTDKLKYNIADVMREDGDFDAATILATIGPRPVRKKKDTPVAVENENIDEIPKSSTIKQEDVIDSLFRSVSAVGGGRFKDDPVAKQQERSSFEEFVMKESRMRESLDDPSLSSRTTLDDLQLPEPTDDTNYAKEVLSSIGPRPSRKSKRAQPMNAREYSDRGGVLALDTEDDDDEEEDDDDDDNEYTAASASKTFEVDLLPEWLRKENEEAKKGTAISSSLSGNEIDVVFDNDKYEHNMRQLAEYEKRRKGQTRSMGIDISDVLGRRDSDDYADFKYDDDFLRSRQNDGWSYGTFSNRKANLLDYIELDVQEINALMDHKDSVYSTGVSQYLPRINKPFKEFGAIFRLEGVIVDVDGLQLQAWTKVAEEFGLKRPTIEDVKLAAVTRPETAVKDIFAWSDDFLECRNIAVAHRRTFKQVFQAWAKDTGIKIPVQPVQESNQQSFAFSSGNRQIEAQIVDSRTSLNESEMLRQTGKAWSATANEYGKVLPDDAAVLIASTLSPDIAVLKVFKWSSDPLEIERIARSYRLNLLPEAERQTAMKSETKTDSAKKPRTQSEMMELHYKAWSDVSKKYGFNPPATDEVLAAFVINEPEIAARGFGWSDDPQMLTDIAKDFLAKLNTYQNGSVVPTPTVTNDPPPSSNQHSEANDSIREELFQIAFDAWSETARIHGYPAPDIDQVQFALSVGPEEAIVTGFEWTTNPAVIVKLLRSYRDAIGRIRGAEYTKPIETPKQVQAAPTGPSQDDIYRTVFDAWTAIAKESGYPLPDDEQVQFALSVGAEEAIVNGFGWTSESAKVAEILGKYKAEIAKRRSVWQNYLTTKSQSKNDHDDIPMYKVTPGVSRWIKSLLDVEMQCAVVSYLEREQVDTLLQLAGLSDLISPDKRISASNGYVTDTDVLLGAALRVERRPDHCVVFDTTPYSSVAAHEVEMQSVCMIGPYPRYELLSADTTTASFDSLSAINIRRLFSERVYDQPLVEVQTTDPGRTRNTKTRTRFYDDE